MTIDTSQDYAAAIRQLRDAYRVFLSNRSQRINFSLSDLKLLTSMTQEMIFAMDEAIYLQKRNSTAFYTKYANWINSSSIFKQKTNQEILESMVIECENLRDIQTFLLEMNFQRESFVDYATTYGRSGASFKFIRISPGDKLPDIALSSGVSEADIIEANGLNWPFIAESTRPSNQLKFSEERRKKISLLIDDSLSDDQRDRLYAELGELDRQDAIANQNLSIEASNKVAYYGDIIRIPQKRNAQLPTSIIGTRDNFIRGSSSAKTTEDFIFGTDLFVNDNGDLEWDNENGDFISISGIPNVIAAQKKYIKVPVGQLKHAPGIGSYIYEVINKWASPGNNRLLAYSLWKTLIQDPRVKSVENVTAKHYGGKTEIEYKMTLIDGVDVNKVRIPIG